MKLWLQLSLASAILLGASAIAKADCLGDFNTLVHGNMSAGPYSVTTQIATGDGQGRLQAVADILWQFVPSDAVHSEMTSTANASPAQFTVIRDKAWQLKPGGSSWGVQSPDHAKDTLNRVRNEGFALSSPIENVQCHGTENRDGKVYLAFSYRDPGNPQIKSVVLYFDLVSKLPVQSIASGEMYGRILQITNQFSFDPSIRIGAPRP